MKYRILDTKDQAGYYKGVQMYIACLYPLQLTHLQSLLPVLEVTEIEADIIVKCLELKYPNRFKKETIQD